MNTKLLALIAWFIAAAALAGGMAAQAAGYRVNLTASAPTGVWRLESFDGNVERGDLVSVCPPRASIVRAMANAGYLEPGSCADGTAALLKPVVAIGGDTVEVTTFGVRVNGVLLPNSKAAHRAIGNTAELRGIAYGAYYVEAGDVWLVSSYSPDSFDSRYFGPVDSATIEGIARPAFVNGDVSHVYGGPRS